MSKKFDMGDYVEVKDRIAQFREKFPEGSLQAEVIPAPEGFIAVKAFAYRTPDDPAPGVGLAWEPFPGETPYTKNSELQNAETSAWGRAIIAVGAADASAGVASANEVRNRQAGGSSAPSPAFHPAQEDHACPHCGSKVYDNRAENYGTKKPLWKCSNKDCGGGSKGYSWASWDDDPFLDEKPIREDYEPVAEPPADWAPFE